MKQPRRTLTAFEAVQTARNRAGYLQAAAAARGDAAAEFKQEQRVAALNEALAIIKDWLASQEIDPAQTRQDRPGGDELSG